jgi:hypothetical protein
VRYLTDRTGYVVESAYPEGGEFDGHRLSPESWDVVADEVDPPA